MPGSVSTVYPNSTYRSCCFHLLFVLLSASLSVFLSNPMQFPPPPHRQNAKHTYCCWWCTGATSWTRLAGTRVQRAAMWPPWPPCWRRWRGPTLRRPANMWWSNWCRVRQCAPKPSPWCPSECGRRGGQSRWLYSHMLPKADGLEFNLCGDTFRRGHKLAVMVILDSSVWFKLFHPPASCCYITHFSHVCIHTSAHPHNDALSSANWMYLRVLSVFNGK